MPQTTTKALGRRQGSSPITFINPPLTFPSPLLRSIPYSPAKPSPHLQGIWCNWSCACWQANNPLRESLGPGDGAFLFCWKVQVVLFIPCLCGSVFAFLRAVVQVTFPGYYHKKLGFPQLLFCASQDCHFGFCAGAAGVRLASQRELNP